MQPGDFSGDVVDAARQLASAGMVGEHEPTYDEPLSVQALWHLHAALHDDVEFLQQDPERDPAKLTELKKRKLLVKDQLAAARQRTAAGRESEVAICESDATPSKDCSAHIAELLRKHEELDQRIIDMQKSPGFDQLEVSALKRQKMEIKERIIALGGTTS